MSLAETLEDRPAPAARQQRLVIEPATPTIGAEISGVDLSRPLDPATFEAIHKALLQWRVLFFRDQELSNDALKAFGRQFGPLTPAHPISEGLDDHPEIWERKVEEYRTRRAERARRP